MIATSLLARPRGFLSHNVICNSVCVSQVVALRNEHSAAGRSHVTRSAESTYFRMLDGGPPYLGRTIIYLRPALYFRVCCAVAKTNLIFLKFCWKGHGMPCRDGSECPTISFIVLVKLQIACNCDISFLSGASNAKY